MADLDRPMTLGDASDMPAWTQEQLLDQLLIAIPGMDLIPDEIMSSNRRARQAMAARDEERHPCVICSQPASFVAVAGPGELVGGARWMDLCGGCYAGVRRLTDSWDEELAAQRWRYLVTEGFIEPAE